MTVEVFKTNVNRPAEAKQLMNLLQHHFPETKISFDLDDCDKVLRLEGSNLTPEHVMAIVNETGFFCDVLE